MGIRVVIHQCAWRIGPTDRCVPSGAGCRAPSWQKGLVMWTGRTGTEPTRKDPPAPLKLCMCFRSKTIVPRIGTSRVKRRSHHNVARVSPAGVITIMVMMMMIMADHGCARALFADFLHTTCDRGWPGGTRGVGSYCTGSESESKF